jgi:hypothetical protein
LLAVAESRAPVATVDSDGLGVIGPGVGIGDGDGFGTTGDIGPTAKMNRVAATVADPDSSDFAADNTNVYVPTAPLANTHFLPPSNCKNDLSEFANVHTSESACDLLASRITKSPGLTC